MTERDAFGREAGEDTLAEAGWRAPAPAAATIEPAPEPAPPVDAPVARPAPPGRRRVRAPKAVVLFLLAFFGFVVVGFGLLVSSIVRTLDEGIDGLGLPDVETVITAPPESVRVPEDPAEGLAPGSLLRADGFGRALVRLRHGGGRAMTLRLAPDRIDTQLRAGRGIRIVQVGADGRLREIARAPLPAGAPGIDLDRVDPAAPQRLLRSAERRFGLQPAGVDYLVLMDLGGEPVWNAFYRGGAVHVQARLDGSITRRVS